jgi:hypothetical protein
MPINPMAHLVFLLVLGPLLLCVSATPKPARAQTTPFRITTMKALLFYEDKGTFSADAAEDDQGPPYVPPKFWNTPMQYENRSTSTLVVIEVSGDPLRNPQAKLEFTASYVPWTRESRAILVRRLLPISIPIKVGEVDKYYAGVWLYKTGCNPVKLTARVIGGGQGSVARKVIKFGCGE